MKALIGFTLVLAMGSSAFAFDCERDTIVAGSVNESKILEICQVQQQIKALQAKSRNLEKSLLSTTSIDLERMKLGQKGSAEYQKNLNKILDIVKSIPGVANAQLSNEYPWPSIKFQSSFAIEEILVQGDVLLKDYLNRGDSLQFFFETQIEGYFQSKSYY